MLKKLLQSLASNPSPAPASAPEDAALRDMFEAIRTTGNWYDGEPMVGFGKNAPYQEVRKKTIRLRM